MLFLHRSPLRSHGNLKPSNCLVDGRMQVKLSGFGLWELKYGQTYRTHEKTTDHSGNHWQVLDPLAMARVVKRSLPHFCFLMLMGTSACVWAFLQSWQRRVAALLTQGDENRWQGSLG